jgi:hypothetical protein
MTAKIYNCEALFLARMENTLLNNKLVSGIACDNGYTDETKTRFYLNIDDTRIITLEYSIEDYRTYESRLLAFFKEAFELLRDYNIEETTDK